MASEKIIRQIDRAIKEAWLDGVYKDYMEHTLENEDCLCNSLYYHLRKKIDNLIRENNIRIYTEWYFSELKYRADLIIAEINPSKDGLIKDKVIDILAIVELKFGVDPSQSTSEYIQRDFHKFKTYISKGYDCLYYFGIIYEVECITLNWLDKRSTRNWAKGHLTELNSGYIEDEMVF